MFDWLKTNARLRRELDEARAAAKASEDRAVSVDLAAAAAREAYVGYLTLAHFRFQEEKRTHAENVAYLLTVLGGEVVIGKDILESVANSDSDLSFTVEQNPDESVTVRLVTTPRPEPEPESEE